ncbi:MAG: DNA-primase RepB domain-containing protein [Rhodanobacteraceae bacterium]
MTDDADRLLDTLAPGEPVTFQTFGEGTATGARGLIRTLHGTLAEHRETLAALNSRGAGIFWTVNATDGKGRKASNVRRVRALFVDLDGAPVEPVQSAPLPPHAIVESSPGRWHAYWRISDCGLGDFTPMQKALATRFNADPKVFDLPRVLRLPGFLHHKSEPFLSHIVTRREIAPYTLAEFRAAFGFGDVMPAPRALPRPSSIRRKLPDVIPEGERNATLLSLAGNLVRKGYDAEGVNDRLQRINAERCTPPLGADEVDAIAAQATGYGSDGFAMMPHRLLDSPEWKALPLRAHEIILLAFRRYGPDTAQTGFALTWADFAGRPGFGNTHTFYAARAQAVASGILRLVSESHNTQTGCTPGLFAIRPDFASVKFATLRQCQKQAPLHIRTALGKKEAGGAIGANETQRGTER